MPRLSLKAKEDMILVVGNIVFKRNSRKIFRKI